MSKQIKDTDYLVISARIRAMENGLLTPERLDQLLCARSDEEVVKLLEDSGYPPMDVRDPEAMDEVVAFVREETLQDLGGSAPDPRYLDIFKLKYDYHNAKSILKADAVQTNPDRMLMDLGRVPSEELKEALASRELGQLPPMLAEAIKEAREVLETTRDPQLSDLVLDRWYFRDMMAVAKQTGSAFLQGYVRAVIDSANLRALVRTLRMGKSPEFLQGVLFAGGTVSEDELLAIAAAGGSGLAELYSSTDLRDAAAAGAEALCSGGLTAFEKLCDEAISSYLGGAKLIPFGEAPLIGYLAARETEYTNLRIVLLGRAAGLAPDVIRSRLRTVY